MLSPSCIAWAPRLTRCPAGRSSHKHHVEFYLCSTSEERKASSLQSLLQVHLSCFGVQHKEISFPWEKNRKMHPKSHRWLSVLIGTLKPVYSSFPRGQGGLEGQRIPYPRQKAGLGTGGGLYHPSPSPAHTASWSCPLVQEVENISCLGQLTLAGHHSVPLAGRQGLVMWLETPIWHYGGKMDCHQLQPSLQEQGDTCDTQWGQQDVWKEGIQGALQDIAQSESRSHQCLQQCPGDGFCLAKEWGSSIPKPELPLAGFPLAEHPGPSHAETAPQWGTVTPRLGHSQTTQEQTTQLAFSTHLVQQS